MGGSELRWLADVTPAAWIRDQLAPFGQEVGSTIPRGYESYCRLFHPVGKERWGEIARRNHRVVHPEMQFHNICRPRGTPSADPFLSDGHERPCEGSLPLSERRVVVEILRDYTQTADRCWFCMWDGFGNLDSCGISERLRLPARDYFFYSGPIEVALLQPTRTDSTVVFGVEAMMSPSEVPRALANAKETLRASFDQSPNLWWPDDRAWVVATEVDYAWTYVGGSRALTERLLADGRVEALQATLGDKPFHDSDLVNATLDTASR
jgi:hypothetical protein